MASRYFSLVLGIVFLLIAVLGFTGIGVTAPPADAHTQHMTVHAQHGYLMGLFPVNLPHNLVHLLSGIAGVVAFRRYDWARMFCRALAVVYGLVTLVGLCPDPKVNTLWGLMPVHGNDVWLHAVIAIAAAYFGFAYRPRTTLHDDPRHDPTGTPRHA